MKSKLKKISLTVLTCLLSGLAFASKVTIADNTDTALTLSQSNYNRIFIANDRIAEAVFPEKAMGTQRGVLLQEWGKCDLDPLFMI